MKDTLRRLVSVFGLCVITATLSSGCATGTPSRPAVNLDDVDYMVIDCSRKAEQIAFLQSLRRTADERLLTVDGWFGYNDRLNQILNHKLRYLANYC